MTIIFYITTNVIITLYNCFITKELFNILVGSVVTISIVSLSTFGAILSKTYLQELFDGIKKWTRNKLPNYLNIYIKFIRKHPIFSMVIAIISTCLFIYMERR